MCRCTSRPKTSSGVLRRILGRDVDRKANGPKRPPARRLRACHSSAGVCWRGQRGSLRHRSSNRASGGPAGGCARGGRGDNSHRGGACGVAERPARAARERPPAVAIATLQKTRKCARRASRPRLHLATIRHVAGRGRCRRRARRAWVGRGRRRRRAPSLTAEGRGSGRPRTGACEYTSTL